jgi:hypothetical protein
MRIYEKSNPEKPTAEPKQHKRAAGEVSSAVSVKDAGQNYRKKEGVRMPFAFLVIVSGGEVRERDYFRKISAPNKFTQIKIEFIADRNQLNPAGLLETAKYKQARYKTSREDEPDKIFIVSDVDHFERELLKIKPECEQLNINLIISNPCFEVWLYYGKFGSKPADFNVPDDIRKISQSFKTYLNSKVKGGIDPRKAIFDISENIRNAKANYEESPNGIPKLFSTNMYLLAESLLPFIHDELQRLIKENSQRIKSHKEI